MLYNYKGTRVTAYTKKEAIEKILRIGNSTKEPVDNKDVEEVNSSLTWGVEGIEKLNHYGDVLFYIVNGTRYGVKPKRGNKHDTEWYYKQLKMGMQASKGFSAGLVQFLNTWIKKGELTIVFKGKATAAVLAAARGKNIKDLLSSVAITEGIKLDKIDVKEEGSVSSVKIKIKNSEFDVSYDSDKTEFNINATKSNVLDRKISGKVKSINDMKDRFVSFIEGKQKITSEAIIDTDYKEIDKGFYKEVSPESYIALWRINDRFKAKQIANIIYLMKKASRELAVNYINSGLTIKYFYSKKEKRGYIRIEYKEELYIIYVEETDKDKLQVVTKKIKKLFPVNRFDLLMCSLPTTTFEKAALPKAFKNVWGEVGTL